MALILLLGGSLGGLGRPRHPKTSNPQNQTMGSDGCGLGVHRFKIGYKPVELLKLDGDGLELFHFVDDAPGGTSEPCPSMFCKSYRSH